MKVSVIIPTYNAEDTIERAIESIPKREDVEIILVNDGSTDSTRKIVEQLLPKESIIDKENGGVATAINAGLDRAKGEYVVFLGSDDYFYTTIFEEAISQLDGTDLVYFNLEIDNGTIWKLTPATKKNLCGSVKFMRREFIGDTREPETERAGEDWKFYNDLLAKNPTEKFTDMVVKHYTYPRAGSLSDKQRKGEI